MNRSQTNAHLICADMDRAFRALLLGACVAATALAPGAWAQDATLKRNTTTVAPGTQAPADTPRMGGKAVLGAIRAPGGTMTVALTAAECTTLGGTSVNESVCNSGKACETTTQNGEWKRVCLSKSE